MRSRVFKLWLAIAAICSTTMLVGAAEDGTSPPMPSPPPLAADRAAAIAREQTGGRVLDVRPTAASDQSSYEVRVLLDEGRVRKVVVNVISGQVQ